MADPRAADERQVSHYRILQKLGEGGMGEVYLAHDLILERRVALKFVTPSLLDDAGRASRFEREARTASALNHPNILTIHELGVEHDVRFIVTEYIEGKTLRERMRSPMALREALEIGAGIAAGLAAAHRAGIVHRDLKPENVMIRTDGVVKLLDFGIAALAERSTDPANARTTEQEVFSGTLAYMSPEQLRAQATDERTDVYSFGVVLFEMLSGRLPFVARTSADLVAAILGHDAPRLSQHVADVPAVLESAVAGALAKEAGDRPAAMSDVLSAIVEARRSVDRDSPAGADATRSADAMVRTDLPAELTPLIGRDAELEQLTGLVQDESTRLVTLTGASGTGKTRLAIAAAHRLRGRFADGVCLVPLGAVSDPALVAPTIAQSLGVSEVPGEPLLSTLQRYLAGRALLLVIDNFEQLIGSASLIPQLLTQAPRLKILITSQAALRVRGERELPVSPLPVPGARDSLEALRRNPAIALLVSRAQDVNAAFQLSAQNAAPLLEICRRLEGLPLAIELTAPRMRILSPEAVLRKLDEPLTFLTAGARDLPPRQQTMRNAIEWSYSHLTADEQRLFRSLAVFSGGWSAEAVQCVCRLASASDDDILECFTSVVDKSLVRRDDDQTGEPRFSMLGTIRSFAAELLGRDAEAAELRSLHATYFVGLAERLEPELTGGGGAAPLRQLDRELHNIRAALNWCLETGQIGVGLRLAGALLPFWLRRGHLSEGRGCLRRLLDESPASDDAHRVRALYGAAVLAEAQGEFLQARSYFQQNLDAQRRRGDRWGIASALNNLGVICLRLKEYSDARARYDESMELWLTLGNRPAVALVLQNLGNIARLERRFGEAQTLYQNGLAEFRAMSDELGVAKCLSLLSDLAREEGKLDLARRLGEESLDIFMRLTQHRDVAVCLGDLGRIELESHNPAEAQSLYHESLLIYRELGDVLEAARMLEALATLAAAQKRPEDAIRIAAIAASLRKAVGSGPPRDERSPVDGMLQAVRDALGQARAADLWREGQSLSLDDAVTLTAPPVT